MVFSSKTMKGSIYHVTYKAQAAVAVKAIRDTQKFLEKAILDSNAPLAALCLREELKKPKSFVPFTALLGFLAEKDPTPGRLQIAKILKINGANATYTASGGRSIQIASDNNNRNLYHI